MRNLVLTVVAVLVLGGMISAVEHSTGQSPARAPQSPVWQYKVVHVTDLVADAHALGGMVPALEKGLNDAGGKGWELCHEISGAVVFKRKK